MKPPNIWQHTRWANRACVNLLQGKKGRIPGRNHSSSHPHQGLWARRHFLSYPLAHWAPSVMLHQIPGSSFGKLQKTHLVITGGASGSSLRQHLRGAALPSPWGSFGRCLSQPAVPACSLPGSGDQPCWQSSGGWFQGLLHLTLCISDGCNTAELEARQAALLRGLVLTVQWFMQLLPATPPAGRPAVHRLMLLHSARHLKHRSNSSELSAFLQSWTESAVRRDQSRLTMIQTASFTSRSKNELSFSPFPKDCHWVCHFQCEKQAQGVQAMGCSSVMLGAGQTHSKQCPLSQRL